MKKFSRIAALVLCLVLALSLAVPAFAAPSKDTGDVTVDQVVIEGNAFDPNGLIAEPKDPSWGDLRVVELTPDVVNPIRDAMKSNALSFAKQLRGEGKVVTNVTIHKGFRLEVVGSAVIPADGVEFTLSGLALPADETIFVMKEKTDGTWELINTCAPGTSASLDSVFLNENERLIIVGFKQAVPTPGGEGGQPDSPQTGMGFPVAACAAVASLAAAAFCLKKSRA